MFRYDWGEHDSQLHLFFISIQKNLLETKNRVLSSYVISVLYGSECWTIYSQIKRLEAAEIWSYRRMLGILWTEYISIDEVMLKMETKRTLQLHLTSGREFKFLGHIMREDGLENLMLTDQIEYKRDIGKQRITYLKSLSLVEQGLGKKHKMY